MTNTMGKPRYHVTEAYRIMVKALSALPAFRREKKQSLLDAHFQERIMLAVTQVNGCALCSYAHTKMALEAGMDAQEIKGMLAGEMDGVPDEEIAAILYAQHVADMRGKPSHQARERLLACYGLPKAKAIEHAISIIMLGNTYGIPFGSFKSRLKHQPNGIDKRSSLPYEIAMLISLVLLPIAFLHALVLSK